MIAEFVKLFALGFFAAALVVAPVGVFICFRRSLQISIPSGLD